jgi:FkbM family methyltransferase
MKFARLGNTLKTRAVSFCKEHLLKDRQTTPAVVQWNKDRGDQTLRLNYPLSPSSIVFDLGGYRGDWSAQIASRYDPNILVFEPLPDFSNQLVKRFEANSKIRIYNCGISDHDGTAELANLGDASSIHLPVCNRVHVQLRDINNVVRENAIRRIDLIKINIEGEEYAVLQRMLDCNIVQLCTDIQVQFHMFYPDAQSLRDGIRQELRKTHFLTYDYFFIWENWRKRTTVTAGACT